MPASHLFWDRIAKRYSRSAISDEDSYEHKLELTRQYLDADMSVLELGCGTGGTAIRHAPHVRQILATDFSQKMLDIAIERANTSAVDNVEFRCVAAEDLAAPTDRFDAVLAMNLIHLVPNWEQLLEQVSALLRPGGVFVSSTACLAEHYAFMRILGPPGRLLGVLPELSFFTEEEYLQAIRRHGLEIRENWKPEGKQRAALFTIAKNPTDC